MHDPEYDAIQAVSILLVVELAFEVLITPALPADGECFNPSCSGIGF